MPHAITVDAQLTKLASARKRTKDAGLQTVVTLGVTLLNPSDDVIAQLIEVQGREDVRCTFAVLQAPLPFEDGKRKKKGRARNGEVSFA